MEAVQEVGLTCPYCGESISVLVEFDHLGVSYIEDCEVCCRPIMISVYATPDGELSVIGQSEDDA